MGNRGQADGRRNQWNKIRLRGDHGSGGISDDSSVEAFVRQINVGDGKRRVRRTRNIIAIKAPLEANWWIVADRADSERGIRRGRGVRVRLDANDDIRGLIRERRTDTLSERGVHSIRCNDYPELVPSVQFKRIRRGL